MIKFAPTVQGLSRGVADKGDGESLAGADDLVAKSERENFTVASWLLPQSVRENLLTIYKYARFVDDLGDLAEGDRISQLNWAQSELDRAFHNSATHPVFVAAGKMAIELQVGREPFLALIAANRQDQIVTRYETFEDLVAYCALSANPVGHLVLAVFSASSPETIPYSDNVCTALQIIEHLQDVAEDKAAGRIYLPKEDMEHFGVNEEMLDGPARSSVARPTLWASIASPPKPVAPGALRRLVAYEAGRARDLLVAGKPLIKAMSGPGKVAVAGFIAGGLAQLDAIARASFDVVTYEAKASKVSVASQSARLLVGSSGHLGSSRWNVARWSR